MKYANKLGARFSIVMGDDEIQNGSIEIKNMAEGDSAKCELSSEAIYDMINKD